MKVLHIGWGFIPWRGGGLIEYAEDLTRAQASFGYEVAYFFSGRHYPLIRRPHLKRWSRNGVRMYELINGPVLHGGDLGTRNPEQDLGERTSERTFKDVLDEWQPDLIHIQELAGLPSSLIEIAKSRGFPVVMTLHDYFLLCPTLRLFDHSGDICLTKEVGGKCPLCCAKAPADRSPLVLTTLRYGVEKHLKLGPKSMKWVPKVRDLARRGRRSFNLGDADCTVPSGALPLARFEEAFQRRRNVNIGRLNMVDLLIGQSRKITEVYCKLGIQADRTKTVHSTVKHLSRIRPALMANGRQTVSFGTMNGCAGVAKGAELILGALYKLQEWGLATKFRLIIMGYINPDLRREFLRFRNVINCGLYDRNELDHLLEQVDVGLVPSIWEEAYGYVGIEFLAKGIPVIGNRMGGIVDYVVPGETGWLNEDNSADGLANVMASLVRDPEKVVAINRNIVANHDRIIQSMDAHVAEMDAIYRHVLSVAKPSAGT